MIYKVRIASILLSLDQSYDNIKTIIIVSLDKVKIISFSPYYLLGTSEGAPCPLLPSNGAIWGIFVAKWDIMSDNSFKVPTFTYLFLLNENNSPNFPISHHLPMSLRENSIGYILLCTKISIFSSSFFLLY